MKVWKNLFGNGDKIHIDNITFELGAISPGRSKNLVFSDDRFGCLIFTHYGLAVSSNTFLLQGYGIGGIRYTLTKLQGTGHVTATVGAENTRSVIIENASTHPVDILVMMFYGRPPTLV